MTLHHKLQAFHVETLRLLLNILINNLIACTALFVVQPNYRIVEAKTYFTNVNVQNIINFILIQIANHKLAPWCKKYRVLFLFFKDWLWANKMVYLLASLREYMQIHIRFVIKFTFGCIVFSGCNNVLIAVNFTNLIVISLWLAINKQLASAFTIVCFSISQSTFKPEMKFI